MLGVLPNSALDNVNKDLGLTQALMKKGLKFFPSNWDVGLILHFPLVLLLVKQGSILEKSGDK